MLRTIGVESLQQLVYNTVPDDILLKRELNLPEALSENEFASHIQKLGNKNKLFKSYIGMGYHPTTLPAVIQRNIFENPSWYTSYTPYQAEISQGRLEALLNFQTVVVIRLVCRAKISASLEMTVNVALLDQALDTIDGCQGFIEKTNHAILTEFFHNRVKVSAQARQRHTAILGAGFRSNFGFID